MPQGGRERLLATMRRLARTEDGGAPVVSCYLDATWADGRAREAARVFVKNRLRQAETLFRDDPEASRSLAEDAERIRNWLESLLAPAREGRPRGVALFTSSGRGLWEEIAASRPFRNQLVVRRVPHLLQLARLADDEGSALLCQVGSRSARILEFTLGGVTGDMRVDHPDVPGRHHQGGWSQMRYQRRIDWLRDQHVREVADVLVRLADRDPQARILLAGPKEPLARLKAALPKRVMERAPVELGLSSAPRVPEIVARVLAALEREEREEEVRLARDVLAEAVAGGLAVAGPEETAAAAGQGAVARLLLTDGLHLRGWRCRSGCLFGGGEPPPACPNCSGPVDGCDLPARVAETVLASGGEVEIVHPPSPLDEAGGMAAQLRFLV